MKQTLIKPFQSSEVDKYFKAYQTNSVVVKNDGLFYVEEIKYEKKSDSVILILEQELFYTPM